MNIQRKEQIFDCIYLFGTLTLIVIFAASTSDELFEVIVYGWIICFWLLRIFLVRCPKCERPVRYMFWPQFFVVRCGRCGSPLLQRDSRVGPAAIQTGRMNKSMIQTGWQLVQLLGALLLFNFVAMRMLGYIGKFVPALFGLGLLILLCLNVMFVLGSRPKSQPKVPIN